MIFLVFGFATALLFGRMLIPVVAALIIAYLLEGAVLRLERRGLARIIAVTIVFSFVITSYSIHYTKLYEYLAPFFLALC